MRVKERAGPQGRGREEGRAYDVEMADMKVFWRSVSLPKNGPERSAHGCNLR